MTVPVHEIARRAADKLSPSFDPNPSQLVEGALASPEAARNMETYDLNTNIAIASLIVAIAAFGWTVYNDMKKPSQSVEDVAILFENSFYKVSGEMNHYGIAV